ncbi:hypothetical protein RRSWK_06075 [Rhodopirellula sp. SWK7]|nr:hypothetical protein RRSWK_06075 [Rhodopirellula sp. SWK7]
MAYKTDSDKPFAAATVTLFANDQTVGEGRVEKCTPNRVTLDETFDIGSPQEPMSPTATTCHSNSLANFMQSTLISTNDCLIV